MRAIFAFEFILRLKKSYDGGPISNHTKRIKYLVSDLRNERCISKSNTNFITDSPTVYYSYESSLIICVPLQLNCN